jgi:hypothetical protein
MDKSAFDSGISFKAFLRDILEQSNCEEESALKEDPFTEGELGVVKDVGTVTLDGPKEHAAGSNYLMPKCVKIDHLHPEVLSELSGQIQKEVNRIFSSLTFDIALNLKEGTIGYRHFNPNIWKDIHPKIREIVKESLSSLDVTADLVLDRRYEGGPPPLDYHVVERKHIEQNAVGPEQLDHHAVRIGHICGSVYDKLSEIFLKKDEVPEIKEPSIVCYEHLSPYLTTILDGCCGKEEEETVEAVGEDELGCECIHLSHLHPDLIDSFDERYLRRNQVSDEKNNLKIGSIQDVHIQQRAITSDHIRSSSISYYHIRPNQVGFRHLLDESVRYETLCRSIQGDLKDLKQLKKLVYRLLPFTMILLLIFFLIAFFPKG